MMEMTTRTTVPSPINSNSTGGERDGAWEMRPGGMLVQKRTDSHKDRVPPPNIRVRVKYGSIYHEVNISSQATFGELKKMLSAPTGLHHQEQKILFKDKERDNNTFLDVVGVKEKSKLVVIEDPISQEKRYLEMRKNAIMEKAFKSISEISLEVDRLAGQVSALELVISKGGRVPEKNVVNVIEQLMNQLLKLDGITADGDVKLQRKMQVKRVQNFVETLDVLKTKNSMPSSLDGANENQQPPSPLQYNQQQQTRRSIGHSPLKPAPAPSPSPPYHQQKQPQRNSSSGPVVITTQWETFDSMPPLIPVHSTSSNSSHSQKFNWDLL
ncbi:BAG family molecular chaperone regulator 3 [Impatiens glandulifera]|uniref:BAG family molecular chaperone regulator 3 n=1 Tax=Impatiens glandulifera TaxID=253017 RepID=UPI001FB1316F|nr:BAG family molecular chaperone regulator 3 [Impatiens glandulifera]